ncbi:hypothetical protein OEZ85_000394, partial [Tetradesmus obliquus]
MPRDMRGTGRYPPQPRFPPFAFYSAVRLGDPELLAKITAVDPYFVTQDNGAGAPLHFAVTYRQLDMAHHLLNNGALVNQADGRGWTPLHRAAHLAHLEGYMEMYEYLLSRGADPSLLTNDTDPYLNPGRKGVLDVAVDDDNVRQALAALNAKYEGETHRGVPKAPAPHPDVGDWWALYDYGLEAVAAWPQDYQHPYPVAAMLEEANTVLGYDLLALIRDGPKSKLDDTVYSQPALFVTNLAALELLRGRQPELVERARVMAGLSLGEYCALVAAGAI